MRPASNGPRRVGVVRDPRFMAHDPGPAHPESPERLAILYETVGRWEGPGELFTLSPRFASEEELCWNHTPSHVERVRLACAQAPRRLDPDTAVSVGSWEAALLAVGGVFEALDAVSTGRADAGVALVRPPGHHAEADRSMGFCLFNNVALGAHYARRCLGWDRVLIVDWDLHHGNGTQRSFWEDSSVLFVSLHQFPYYPGTGRVDEVGGEEGEGFTINVPFPAGAGDEDYAAAFNRIVLPLGEAFRPDVILVSAGFDIHRDDPLGGMRVTKDGFASMTRCMVDLAASCCEGRVVFVLEGGYAPSGLREGLEALLWLVGGGSIEGAPRSAGLSSARTEFVETIAAFLSRWWPVLS